MSQRGRFIVFEGLDRCGKTTQVNKLVQRLEQVGQKCVVQRFPDRQTQIGQMISEYLNRKCELEDHAVHLLFTANRWELMPKIRDLLEKGIHVICDRYSYSGIAYSAAKPTLTLSWCESMETDLLMPDQIIYLHLKNTVGDSIASRAGFGEERYENTDMQSKVEQNYHTLWSRPTLKSLCQQVNAAGTVDEVHDRVWEAVQNLF